MSRSILETIADHAIQHGDSIAVRDGTSTLTYRQLLSRADALAADVDAWSPHDLPVGIVLPGGVDYVVSILGLLIAGRTAVPMDDGQPDERQRRILDSAGLAGVIVDASTAVVMRRIAPTLRQLTAPMADAAGAQPLRPRRTTRPDHIFAISFTSGSTGEPKGVCRSEHSLASRFSTFVPELPLTSEDRVPLLESISIGMSINLALNALCAGAQLEIIDLRRLGLRTTIDRLAAFSPTVYAMVSSTFQTLFATDLAAAADLGRGVRWVRLGGDPVRHADVTLYRRRFPPACRLFVAMGASETGTFASWGIDHETPLDRPLVPVGYPERGVEIELRDDHDEVAAPGDVGEIVVTSPALALGYWRDEALTRARFSPSRSRPGSVSYRTGDFGRFLPGGLLECVGRRDRQIKIRGNTVHPGEVEATLSRCPGVTQVAVVACANATGPTLAAFFTASEHGADEPLLRTWSRDHLSPPARPAHFTRLDEMPVLPTGKLDLAALTAREARDKAPVPATATAGAESALDAIVREAWLDVLRGGAFDADLPFDMAGGNSLNGLTLIVRLEAALGRTVPMGTLGAQTTPRELIDRLRDTARPAVAGGNDRPHIVLFPGLWGDDIHTTDFFRSLADRFTVTTSEWRLGGDALSGDFDGARYLVESVAAIRGMAISGRLWLMGYSFGGRLAVEVARRLLDVGLHVETVVVLDGEAGRRINAPSPATARTLTTRFRAATAEHGGVLRALVHGVTMRIASAGARRHVRWAIRGAVAAVARWGSDSSRRAVAREIARVARLEAFADLPSGFLPMPIVLLFTDEPTRGQSRPDLGWASRCTQLRAIPVGGSHLTMLSQPTRNVVLARLAELEVALRPA